MNLREYLISSGPACNLCEEKPATQPNGLCDECHRFIKMQTEAYKTRFNDPPMKQLSELFEE